MRKSNGYSQRKLNNIKDCASSILEEVTRMEMAWQNSDALFKDGEITLDEFLEVTRDSLKQKTIDLNFYLEPREYK